MLRKHIRKRVHSYKDITDEWLRKFKSEKCDKTIEVINIRATRRLWEVNRDYWRSNQFIQLTSSYVDKEGREKYWDTLMSVLKRKKFWEKQVIPYNIHNWGIWNSNLTEINNRTHHLLLIIWSYSRSEQYGKQLL